MKKIILILSCLIFTVSSMFAQSGWVWQNPLPQGNTLNDVQFLNSNTGYVAGSQGIVLKTINSGASWSVLQTGSSYEMKTVFFFDVNTGYAAGGNHIMKTTDGGNSWQLANTVYPPNIGGIQKLTFVNQSTGFGALSDGKTIRTTNGSTTWNFSFGTAFPLYSIVFINPNTGFTSGHNGTLLKTTDAGVNWVNQNLSTSLVLYSVFFSTPAIGYVAGANGILRKSSDAGVNWNIIIPSGTTEELLSINFINQSTGVITGSRGIVLRTSDDGNSWQNFYTGTYNNLKALDFADNNTGFAVGEAGVIIKTTNTGLNWNTVSSGSTKNLSTVKFIDLNTGYAVGDTGTFLKTTNGGAFWQTMSRVTTNRLNSFFFFDANTGFVAGGNGSILKTSNGGSSWATTNAGFNWLSSIHFTDDNTGYAIGSSDAMQKTTNRGNTWFSINPSLHYSLNSLFFTSSTTAFAVGLSGKLIKTTNACTTWTTIDLSLSNTFNCITFIDANTGYICGEDSIILRTTNGGNIWIQQNPGTPNGLKSIVFINNNTGYIAGRSGTVIKTTNGGNNWIPVNSGTTNDINSISKDASGNVFIAGNYGNILKLASPIQLFSVSGTIRFADNSQPVNSGKVKAVKYDIFTHQIVTVDSALIQSNGAYTLTRIPEDSLDIMAFQDDELAAPYVPTYYVSTMLWKNSNTIFPNTNLTGVDVNVLRNNPGSGSFSISGNVSSPSLLDNYLLKDAVVYAKIGNEFKGYGVTNSAGNYSIDNLAAGNYDITVDYLWHTGETRNMTISTSNLINVDFILHNVIGIEPPGTGLPSEFRLRQNYPNPFNPVTVVLFDLPHASFTKLIVYDILGREVVTLVNQELRAGTHSADWNASGCPSGIYFYRLETKDFTDVKKMVLLK